MEGFRAFFLFALGLAVAVAGYAHGAKADRLLVTSGGTVLRDVSTPESEDEILFYAVAGPESSGVNTAVILTAPTGEPPGEDPIFVPGTDLIARAIVTFHIAFSPPSFWIHEVFLIPDGYPGFESVYLPIYAPYATLLEATGSLQDLTSPLHSDAAGWQVQVQYDVIPEPGTAALLAAGLAALAARSRTRFAEAARHRNRE
jgi:hypothetical protein